MEIKRRENENNFSSLYLTSSSDDEPAPKKNWLVSNLVLPCSKGKEASDNSVEAIIVRSGENGPVIVQGKNKCSKIKSTTKKGSFKRAGEKKRESSKRVSVAMDNFKKFSKSLIEELEVDCQQIFEQMKKDLENLSTAKSTLLTRDDKGKGIRNSSHAQEQKITHSEPKHGEQHQNPSAPSSNFIIPTGPFATNTGYFTNLLKQASNPGKLSYPHGNNVPTFGMGSAGFPLPVRRRLGSASYITNRTKADNSMGGRPIMLPWTSHASTDSVLANRFRDINFYEDFEMNEAWLRRHGRRNGDPH